MPNSRALVIPKRGHPQFWSFSADQTESRPLVVGSYKLIVSGIPFVLGLRTRMLDSCVSVAFRVPSTQRFLYLKYTSFRLLSVSLAEKPDLLLSSPLLTLSWLDSLTVMCCIYFDSYIKGTQKGTTVLITTRIQPSSPLIRTLHNPYIARL